MGTGEFLRITQADRAPTRLSTVTPGGSKSQPPSPRTDPAPPTHSAAQPARLPAPISRCRGHRTSQRRVPQAQLPPTHRGRAASLPPSSQVRLLKARCFPPPPRGGVGGHLCELPGTGAPRGGDWEASWVLDPFPTASPKPSARCVQPPTVKKLPPPLLQPCTPEPRNPQHPPPPCSATSSGPRLTSTPGLTPVLLRGARPTCRSSPGSPALRAVLVQGACAFPPCRRRAPGGRHPAAQLWPPPPGPGPEAGQVLKTVRSPPEELPGLLTGDRSFHRGSG